MDVKQKLVQVSEGVYVEADALRIAEKINEYDSNLRLKYCESSSSLQDAPYILVEICPDGVERIVFSIWELDDRVIQKLYEADTNKLDINAMLDKANADAKKAEQRRYKEMKEEVVEMTSSIIASPKEVYKMTDPLTGNKLKIHQNRPVEVEEAESE